MASGMTGGWVVGEPLKWRRSAAACLMAATMLVSAAAVWAQEPGGQPVGESANAVAVDIPSGPLAQALNAVAEAFGLQLAYDAEITRDKQSPGLNGTFTAEEALRGALAGTGLTYRFTGATTVTLERVAAIEQSEIMLDPVTVRGQKPTLEPPFAGGQVARGGQLGVLGNTDVMNTPFNITDYTSKLIEDQQARSIADVVINDPSTRYSGTQTQTLDLFNIRGFLTRSAEVAFAGVYGIAPDSQIGVETVERVEVLKGPGAMLYGMSPNGGIGGTINVIPKRADDRPLTRLTGLFASEAQPGAHLDVGRRFGNDGKIGLRLNAVYRNGDTAVEGNSQDNGDVALALDFRGEQVRVSTDLGYQRRRSTGLDADSYLAAGAQVPEAPDAGSTYFQDWTSMRSDAGYGVVRGEFDATPNLTAFAATGFGRNRGNMVLSYALDLDSLGNFQENFWGQSFYSDNVAAEAGVRLRFETASIRHQPVLSAAFLSNETGNVAFFDGSIDGTVSRPPNPSNIYYPVAVPKPNLGGFPSVPKISEAVLSGLALADTLSFADETVRVMLGARLQRVRVENFDTVTGATASNYDEDALSPAAGLVVRPWSNVSFYGNYIQGLIQGPTAEGTAVNAGQVFAPTKVEQYEGGVKVERGSLVTTLSVFQIAQPVGRTDPATLIFDVDGEQRNRGVELNAFGEPMRGTRVLGGVMLLDARLTKTEAGTNDGKRAPGARVNVNLGGEWDATFLPGLTLSARGIYTGSAYVDPANTQKIPAWGRIDIGARHAFTMGDTPVTLRANIENLFDQDYWRDEFLYRGAPRTFLVSATVDL
ncbi:MAG: TonB-dependent siderophore receptor [Nitrospirota bacterium]